MASEERPGAEFLQRRLARATAIPAAERPPDVAAFVESVQLLREVCDLLPLKASGSPALQMRKPAARRQMQLALLKVARAIYVCPFKPVSDRPHVKHIAAYCMDWIQCKRDASSSGLELVMFSLACSLVAEVGTEVEQTGAASQLSSLLDNAVMRQEVSGQLAQLAAASGQQQLPLSVEQLQYVCCCVASQEATLSLSDYGTHVAEHGVSATSAAAFEGLAAVGPRCAAQLLQLEPGNPKGHFIAASMASAQAASTGPSEHMERAIDHSMQAMRLAQQHNNDWALASSANFAVTCTASAVSSGIPVSRSTVQAALEAYQQAEQALRRCKHVLPKLWVDVLQIVDDKTSIQRLQAALRGQPEPPLPPIAARMQRALQLVDRADTCDGCGQYAVGMRRCARCREAQYCSTECQRQHWKVHKRECRPA